MTPIDVLACNDFNDKQISHRALLEDPVTRVALVSLRAGQGLPEHAAETLTVLYVASGSIEFHRGGEALTLAAGQLLRLVPGERHSVQAKEDARLLVTMVKPAEAALWNALAPKGRELDLRPVPRPQRHSTVFYAFDQLGVGESFFIVNDHDPQPLRFQIEQARPGEMSWEYAVRGPELFRIQVARVSAPAAAAHV